MKQRKVIHFNIPAEDDDIIHWKNSLQPRTFNMYVNEILLAESKGEVAHIPREFSSEKEIVPVNGRLIITDPAVLTFIGKMKRGHVTDEIKNIIRKQVYSYTVINLGAESVRADLIEDIMKDFRTKILEKKKEYVGVPDKYRDFCDSYQHAVKSLKKALLECCAAETNMLADSKLMHFDPGPIVDDSFNAVFGEPEEDDKDDWENDVGDVNIWEDDV